MRIWLIVLVVLVAGCISPVQKLGCCIAENAEDGCILYNTTTFETQDYTAQTNGPCNDNASGTLGHCNVTIDGRAYLIPFCTDDQFVECINSNCTAMVCGDFQYRPRIAPSFTSIEDSAGDVPPGEEDSAAQNFYHAQCRFLPMDASLRQIMKNSKSQINVFRMGVGGSFDEFDQYRYFFPMSDMFCSINPEGTVDRYMNYLSWQSGNANEFDPSQITSNCIDDDNISGPFSFSEENETRDSTHVRVGNFEYDTVLPDESNYKFAHYAIVDLWSDYHSSNNGYYSYGDPFIGGVYKKIDAYFYRKELAIAHQGTILAQEGATRAPFECSFTSYDCYSGTCGTEVWNRGMMIEKSDSPVPVEIQTDCNRMEDENGQTRVVCAPTKGVVIHEGWAPTVNYGQVEIAPARMQTDPGYSGLYTYSSLASNMESLLEDWNEFSRQEAVAIGRDRTVRWSLDTVTFYSEERSECEDYESGGSGTVLCSNISQDYRHPPIGGITFFGKVGGNAITMPDGSVIIGYSLVRPEDFHSMYFVENCDISFNSSNPYENNRFMFDLETNACQSYCNQRLTYSTGCIGNYNTGDYYYGSESECNDAHRVDWIQRCLDGYAYSTAEARQECGEGIGIIDYSCFQTRMEMRDANPVCENYYDEFDEFVAECTDQCLDFCENVNQELCEDFCQDGMFGRPGDVVLCFTPEECAEMAVTMPTCNIPGEDPLNAKITDSFYRIDFEEPGDDVWQTMMRIFRPYFEDRVKNGIMASNFGDGCGEWLSKDDAIISSIPWIVNYKKYINLDGSILMNDVYLSSTSAQAIRERNLFGRSTANSSGTSSCELRSSTLHPLTLAFGDSVYQYHDIAYSKNIYLIKYQPGSERIGRCAIDDTTYMPVVNTYGWCEPCTESTLAYQGISAEDRVYMPAYTANVEDDEYDELQTICELKYDYGYSGGGVAVTDNVSCFNAHITDINDYKESIGGIGSPRTIPEASILKERMGSYMKSGVLPVLDLTNETNWNIENPDATGGFSLWWFNVDFGSENEYLEYDFERLVGSMGAAIIIVDTIDEPPDASRTLDILERTAIVREKCFGCMAAVQVNDALSADEFREMILPLLEHPSGQLNIDLITFNYEVSAHTEITTAEGIVEDIEEYGRTALTTPSPGRGKPTMIVGFNIRDDDSRWSYSHLFSTIVTSQDNMIRAGVTGIIYSPVRQTGQESLVGIEGGVGVKKDEKFCAMQSALQRMSQSPPTAVFTKIVAQEDITCQRCSSLEITLGECDRTCDDGSQCTMPDGATDSHYKCQDNTVSMNCPLCTELPGNYNCIIRYANGSQNSISGAMSQIDSDIWMDVIGGMEAPYRCCLEDSLGIKYSYYKESLQGAINKPVVFPKLGDPNVDCGMGDSSDLSKLSNFCNINNVPITDYDIECER
ncbi:hypothetical protein JXA56_05265 [Candidatus Micrarchaeota archaeon]|nr:hypothetical protein [Candidatus Micrarchaeota archaeon]